MSTQIQHPKEEPTWVHLGRDNWRYQSGDRIYGQALPLFWEGINWFAYENEESGRKEKGRVSPGLTIEHGKRLVEEAVAAWRAEGVLV